MALIHAWVLAVMLAAILVGAVTVPAIAFGVRVSRSSVLEAVCATAIGVIVLAELAAVL